MVTCLAVVFDVGTAFVIFKYWSVITMIKQLPCFVHGSVPRIFIAINSSSLDAGNTCTCSFVYIFCDSVRTFLSCLPSHRRSVPCATSSSLSALYLTCVFPLRAEPLVRDALHRGWWSFVEIRALRLGCIRQFSMFGPRVRCGQSRSWISSVWPVLSFSVNDDPSMSRRYAQPQSVLHLSVRGLHNVSADCLVLHTLMVDEIEVKFR